MSRFLKFFFVATIATVVIACSSDYEYAPYVPEMLPEAPTEVIYFTEDELLVLMQMQNPGNRICIDQATETALDAISFFGGATTRSGAALTIAGVTALQSEPSTRVATRSANGSDVAVQIPDTVAFVFNFADDAGFTIVAADTRINSPILAFVEDGYLDLSEKIDHPGLAVFFEGLEKYIEWAIVRSEELRDSLMPRILEKLGVDAGTKTRWGGDTCTTCWLFTWSCQCPPANYMTFNTVTRNPLTPWTVAQRRGPLLQVEWGQLFPFNYLVRNRSCAKNNWYNPVHWFNGPCSNPREIYTGCVATATAMLMTFWGHPAQIDGHPMNWGLLRRFTARPDLPSSVIGAQRTPRETDSFIPGSDPTLFKNNVARLMERIGAGVSMTYGCFNHGGSSAQTRNAVTFLRRHGYVGGDIQSFNSMVVRNSISNNRPVLVRGNNVRNSTWFYTLYREGHAWVIDGYIVQQQQATMTTRTYRYFGNRWELISSVTTAPFTDQMTFFHNNWGWSEQNNVHRNRNGFFVAGSFDTQHRIYHSTGDWREPSYGTGTANFRYNIEIFPNIRR